MRGDGQGLTWLRLALDSSAAAARQDQAFRLGQRMKPTRLQLAALMTLGLTASAAAQFLAPGMSIPGQAPPQQQQMPPCFAEFAPLKAEAEKRGLAVKVATEKKEKPPREEVCALIKRYS